MPRAAPGDAAAAAGAAVAILEPLGPGIELAWAYANLANQQMLSGEGDAAIEMARRAQAVAGPLGAPEVISDALNTEGCAAFNTGRGWLGQLRDALRIAISEGLEAQAGRAYCNLQSMHFSLRQFGDAEQAYLDGIAYCDEHDIATYATFLRSGRTNALERTGRWEEALAMGGEILDLAAPSPIIRLCPLSRIGMILARRAEPGAWECLDEAKQLTRRESEVLDLICAGYTNAAISAELFISAKTVDHHVSAILAKLGAPNRNAAAAQAARLGLVGGAGAAGNAGLRSPRRRAAADLRCRIHGRPPLARPRLTSARAATADLRRRDPGEIPGERR
jgi:DNA-binding CsgD family transcriptional regulator